MPRNFFSQKFAHAAEPSSDLSDYFDSVGQALATEAIAECIRSQSGERPGTCSGTALFEFGTVAANTSELFGSLEKSPLPALPFFLGC